MKGNPFLRFLPIFGWLALPILWVQMA